MNKTPVSTIGSNWSPSRLWLCLLLFVLSNAYWALHCLDDAFIHLRYAELLVSTGKIQFNVGQPGYGTSSPMFLYMLAALLKLGLTSIWLPKVLSVLFYALLIHQVWTLGQHTKGWVSDAIWIILLLLVMPMSSRWLSNGMETSLVAWLAVYAGCLLVKGVPDLRTALCWSFAWSVACITRPEFLALALLAGACSLLTMRGTERLRAVGSLALAMGLALLQYLWVFGHVSPDTAIAKSAGFSAIHGFTSMLGVLMTTIGTFASSTTLGVAMGLMLVWTVWCLMTQRPLSVRLALSLAAFFGLMFMIAARGQAIQGVRYFVFIVFFMLPLVAQETRVTPKKENKSNGIATPKAWAVVAVLMLVSDALLCWPVMKGRSETTVKFIHQDLSAARDLNCVGYDIGYVSYFTGCRMHDMAGLVNGRSVALLSAEDRISRLKTTQFEYVFANDGQLKNLESAGVLHRDQYAEVGSFDFPNVGAWWNGQKDTHILYKLKPVAP